jgi:hypothetical protein
MSCTRGQDRGAGSLVKLRVTASMRLSGTQEKSKLSKIKRRQESRDRRENRTECGEIQQWHGEEMGDVRWGYWCGWVGPVERGGV